MMMPNGYNSPDDMESLLEQGDWREYYLNQERAGRMQMETPAGFIQSATLSNDMQAMVNSMLAVAQIVYDAADNNRFGRLRRMRVALMTYLEAGGHRGLMQEEVDENGKPTWTPAGLMTPLPPLTEDMELPDQVWNLAHRIEELQDSIERDTEDGHFNDFTMVKELFAKSDIQSIYQTGAKLEGLTFFHKLAANSVETARQGTRIPHTEAIGGRMLQNVPLEQQALQRGSQKGRWSRNRRPDAEE